MKSAKSFAESILAGIDVHIDGTRPWDMQVRNDAIFSRVMSGGSLALGEAYMDGWWDTDDLDELMYRIIRYDLKSNVPVNLNTLLLILSAKLTNRQSADRAFEVGEKHYNIGNDLYEHMLDPWMQYSCGYWERGAHTLAQAQEAKLDLIARKLKLEKGMRVLDVGCGWGGLSKYLAEKHDVFVDGITISTEQAKYAEEWVGNLPVNIRVVDYRNLDAGPYDRIVSVGMFEHVGYKNYRTFMKHMRRLLKDDGIFLLHTIGAKRTLHTGDPWMDRYIFPNGMLPSVPQIGTASEDLFVMEDWHNFGMSYHKTLHAWHDNIFSSWEQLSHPGKYDERFRRMWHYYLMICAGGFRARYNQLWQIVLTKGRENGYESVR